MSIRRFEIGPLSTNCYILTDEKTNESVIIDPAFCTEKLLQEAEKTNIKYILLTHAHADHIMAVHSIKEKCGAKIVAHENEAERLLSARANLHSAIGCYLEDYIPEEIDIKAQDGDVLEFGEKRIIVLHTPGHTDGSLCFVCEDVIFCGDTIFKNSYGRTDFPSGNLSQLIDSYYKLCSLEGDYMMLPGHQESTTLDYERNFNPLSRYL
ncbi:MAG: MBL fold metallo-hydrolase [Clostridia bacterium]|nr:MBL fold metallo-hydrolase [Clostridia bacterium]